VDLLLKSEDRLATCLESILLFRQSFSYLSRRRLQPEGIDLDLQFLQGHLELFRGILRFEVDNLGWSSHLGEYSLHL